MKKNISYLYILSGAALWGIIGFFVTNLYELGFTPTQVVAVRAFTTAIFLIVYIFFKQRESLKFNLKDSRYFVGTGIISIVFFNLCLFNAIQETSISIAAILLYTAPAFVAIISRFLFKEALTSRKLFALITTFIGCALVIGVFPKGTDPISAYGFLLGIGSGFFYALYSIFGKFALAKYNSLTVTVYTFIFAAIAITPFSQLWTKLSLFSSLQTWVYIVGLSFLSTMLAYLFYTKGLETVETSRASIMATIEPVVAALTGFVLFNETLQVWQYVGIILVITAVMIVQERKPKASLLQRKIGL